MIKLLSLLTFFVIITTTQLSFADQVDDDIVKFKTKFPSIQLTRDTLHSVAHATANMLEMEVLENGDWVKKRFSPLGYLIYIASNETLIALNVSFRNSLEPTSNASKTIAKSLEFYQTLAEELVLQKKWESVIKLAESFSQIIPRNNFLRKVFSSLFINYEKDFLLALHSDQSSFSRFIYREFVVEGALNDLLVKYSLSRRDEANPAMTSSLRKAIKLFISFYSKDLVDKKGSIPFHNKKSLVLDIPEAIRRIIFRSNVSALKSSGQVLQTLYYELTAELGTESQASTIVEKRRADSTSLERSEGRKYPRSQSAEQNVEEGEMNDSGEVSEPTPASATTSNPVPASAFPVTTLASVPAKAPESSSLYCLPDNPSENCSRMARLILTPQISDGVIYGAIESRCLTNKNFCRINGQEVSTALLILDQERLPLLKRLISSSVEICDLNQCQNGKTIRSLIVEYLLNKENFKLLAELAFDPEFIGKSDQEKGRFLKDLVDSVKSYLEMNPVQNSLENHPDKIRFRLTLIRHLVFSKNLKILAELVNTPGFLPINAQEFFTSLFDDAQRAGDFATIDLLIQDELVNLNDVVSN